MTAPELIVGAAPKQVEKIKEKIKGADELLIQQLWTGGVLEIPSISQASKFKDVIPNIMDPGN